MNLEKTKKINSLLDNRIKIFSPIEKTEKDVTIGEIVHAVLCGLKNEKTLNPASYSVRLTGSSLTNACIEDVYPECNDIDLKIIILDERDDQEEIFFKVNRIILSSLGSLFKNPFYPEKIGDLKAEGYSPYFIPPDQYRSGYTLSQEDKTQLPFDISVHVIKSRNSVMHVSNMDSLYVELNAFGRGLGTRTAGVYELSSDEGNVLSIESDIQKQIITMKAPEKLGQFAWYRYLMRITEGCTDPVFSNNVILYTIESRVGDRIVPNLEKFISDRRTIPDYVSILLVNALFHSPENDPLRILWSKVGARCLKGVLSNPIPESHVSTLIKLLMPLFAEEVTVKTHLGEPQLQCSFTCNDVKLYVMVPFFKESDAQYIPDLEQELEDQKIFNVMNLKEQNLTVPKDLYQMNLSLSSNLSIAWAIKFPSLFSSFFKEEKRRSDVFDSVKNGDFSLAKLKLLFCKELSVEEIKKFLQDCNIERLSAEEILFITQRIPDLIELFRLEPLAILPLIFQLLQKIPEGRRVTIAAKVIKQIIKIYEGRLEDLPLTLWMELFHLYPFVENCKSSSSYFLFFLGNLAFQGLGKGHISKKWLDCFGKVKELNKTSWMRSLAILCEKYPEESLDLLFPLLIPLFADKLTVKFHLGKPCCLCEFISDGETLPIFVSFLEDFKESPLLQDKSFFSAMKLKDQKITNLDPSLMEPYQRLPLDFKVAWALKFPELFSSFLKEMGKSVLLQNASILNQAQVCKYLAKEEIGQKISDAVQKGDFSLAKAQLLLSNKLSLEDIETFLPGCSIIHLTKEEVSALTQQIPYLISQLIRHPASHFEKGFPLTSLLLDLLSQDLQESQIKIFRQGIRDMLNAYASNLQEVPEAFWKDLTKIVKHIPTASWKRVVIPLVLNALPSEERSFLDFLRTLSLNTKCVTSSDFSDDINRFSYHMNSFDLLRKLDLKESENHLLQALEIDSLQCIQTCDLRNSLEFEDVIRNLIKNKETLKVLRFLKESKEPFPRLYLELFNGSTIEEKKVVISSYLETLQSCLEKKQGDALWNSYQHFHSVPEVAEYLETNYLSSQEALTCLEEHPEKYNQLQTAIGFYIGKLVIQKNVQMAFFYSLFLRDSNVAHHLAKVIQHSIEDYNEGNEVASFVLAYFPSNVEEILDELFQVRGSLIPHRFFLSLPLYDERIKNLNPKKFFSFLIKDLFCFFKSVNGSEEKETLAIVEEYLKRVTDEDRWDFAIHCTSLSSQIPQEPLRFLFNLSLSSMLDLKLSFEQHPWKENQETLQKFIPFLTASKECSKEQVEMVFRKIENPLKFASLIEDILPHCEFIPEPLLDSIFRRLDPKTPTSEVLSYLSFLLRPKISSILQKDSKAFYAFLVFSTAYFQYKSKAKKSSEIAKVIELLQCPPREDLEPDIKETRWKAIGAYVESLASSDNIDWIVKEMTESQEGLVPPGMVKKMQDKFPQVFVTCFQNICQQLDASVDENLSLTRLGPYIEYLSSNSLSLEEKKKLKPAMQILAQYLIDIQSRVTGPFISKHSSKIIKVCLSSQDFLIANDLIQSVHINRLKKQSLSSVEIDLEMYFLYIETILPKIGKDKNEIIPYPFLLCLFKMIKNSGLEMEGIVQKTLKSSIRLCDLDSPNRYAFAISMLGFELLLKNQESSQNPSCEFLLRVNALAMSAYQRHWEGLDFYFFYNMYTQFIEKVKSSSLSEEQKMMNLPSLPFQEEMAARIYESLVSLGPISLLEVNIMYQMALFFYQICPEYTASKLDIPKECVLNISNILIDLDCNIVVNLARCLDNDSILDPCFVTDLLTEIKKREPTVNRNQAIEELEDLLKIPSKSGYWNWF